MPAVPVKVKMTITRPPDVATRKWPKILRGAMERMGWEWWRNYLPGHFRAGTQTKYQYQPRKPKYKKQKVRRSRLRDENQVADGGRTDLVYSGEARRLAKKRPLVRGFPSRARVYLHTPNYITMRPRGGSNRPNMGMEITKATPDEVRALQRVLKQRVEKGVNAIREKRVVKT